MSQSQNSILGELRPSKAIVKLAVPATIALLAKAVYNIVDTAYIGMLHSDIALAAVGVSAAAVVDHGVCGKYLCRRGGGAGRPAIRRGG